MYSYLITFALGFSSYFAFNLYMSRNTKITQLRSASTAILNSMKNGCLSEAKLVDQCLVIEYMYQKKKWKAYLPFISNNEELEYYTLYSVKNGKTVNLQFDPRTKILPVSPAMLGIDMVLIDYGPDGTIAQCKGDEVYSLAKGLQMNVNEMY